MLNLLGMERWLRRSQVDAGLDLGSARTRWAWPDGRSGSLPTCLTLDLAQGTVLLSGQAALESWGRLRPGLKVVHPVEGGVIADFDAGEAFLRQCLEELGPRPTLLMAAPSDVTAVESRTLVEAARQAGAAGACVLPQALIAAVGAGLPVAQAVGSMIVELGAGTSQAAVLSVGSLVCSSCRRQGGHEHNLVLGRHLRESYHLEAGPRSLEQAKLALGQGAAVVEVRGKDVIRGLPACVRLRQGEYRELMLPEVARLVELMLATAEATPPELLSQIMQNGAVLSGGVSQWAGLCETLAELSGIPCRLAEEPEESVLRGMRLLLTDRFLLNTVLAALGETSLAAV